MVSSTAMPMVMAVMVMVIKSSGNPIQPIRPSTSAADTRLGTMLINATGRLRNRISSMIRMAANT